MHEYSIVGALIERVSAEASARGASRVHRLHVDIGALSGVEIDLLNTAYQTFRSGSVCEEADLEVRRVVARWVCDRCGTDAVRTVKLRCAECAGPLRLAEGDEIVLTRIEMEVEAHV